MKGPPGFFRLRAALFSAATFLVFFSLLAAQGERVINYKGQLGAGVMRLDALGSFKFALVSADGSKTYWSNDGTSIAGGEPIGAVSVRIVEGSYVVALGDPSLRMSPLPTEIFSKTDLWLRIWLRIDSKYKELTPDQRMGLIMGNIGNTVIAGGLQHVRGWSLGAERGELHTKR